MSRRRAIAGLSVCGLVIAFALFAVTQSPPTAAQTDDETPGIPKFYAQSRQILVAVTVWDKGKTDTSWIPKDVLKQHSLAKDFFTIHPPVPGLRAKNFHVYDNETEQTINYFKEVYFPGANLTNEWFFVPENRGTWGQLEEATVALDPPKTTYLIGYAPPALNRDECRTIRVVVEGYDAQLNRKQYCATKNTDSVDESPVSTKLALQMQKMATTRKVGSITISVQAFTFWSSGVLSLVSQTPQSADVSSEPTAEYKYVVEVHDAKAPATVQVAVGFPGRGSWASSCPKSPAINLLGLVYRSSGELAGKFRNTFPCRQVTKDDFPGLKSGVGGVRNSIPDRFDTQLELTPGEYELHVVISDGNDFGHAWMPLHVEPLNPQQLKISDLVVAGVVRYSGWVLLDAAALTPSPIIPSPLVSKDSQYFPDSDKTTRTRKRMPLYLYFEIYEPQNGTQGNAVYYRWRIKKQKGDSVVISSDRLSAADWVVPGNVVIPIGLELDTEKLKKGDYRLEMQASDSAGRESQWRAANFNIQ